MPRISTFFSAIRANHTPYAKLQIFKSSNILFLLLFSFTVSAQSSNLELDHLYIIVPKNGDREKALLQQAGFNVDTFVTQHSGQGTASRSLLFENFYLELLWTDEEVPVKEANLRDKIQFARRTYPARNGSSPFGLGFHFKAGMPDSLSFAATRYSEEWMRPGTYLLLIDAAEDTSQTNLFVVPRYMGINAWATYMKNQQPQLFQHPSGARRLTGLTLYHNRAGTPPRSGLVSDVPHLKFASSDANYAELTFDNGKQKQQKDFRPALPLVIRW